MINLSSKTTSEAVTIAVDFKLLVPTIDTASVSVSAIRFHSVGTNLPTTGTPIIEGTIVRFLVSGGDVGDFKIVVTANSGANVLKESLRLHVNE